MVMERETTSREAEILGVRRIALHEALAVAVGEVGALAARALRHQHAGVVDAGGVELHELHVLQRQAGAQHHGGAVAGLGVGAGAAEVGAAVAAGGDDGLLGAEAVQRAVVELQGHHAAADAVLVDDQVDGEVLDEELRRVPQRLAVEGVQHGVAGAVGHRAGAHGRRALAVLGGHAAERALVDLAVLGARERHAVVLQLVDRGRGVAAQVLDGVLVAQPVGALHRVVHVPAPVVRPHVAERRGDAALGRHRVRAGGEHLGDAGGSEARLGAAERGAQTGAAGAHHHHVVGVIGERIGPAVDGGLGYSVSICGHASQAPKLNFSTANTHVMPTRMAKNVFSISATHLAPLRMHVVLDDGLHAEAHVHDAGQHEQQQRDGDVGLPQSTAHRGVVGAGVADQEPDQEADQEDVGDGGEPLQPEVLGAVLGRAQAADLGERGALAHVRTGPRGRGRASTARRPTPPPW